MTKFLTTKFLTTKFLATKFLTTKFPTTKFLVINLICPERTKSLSLMHFYCLFKEFEKLLAVFELGIYFPKKKITSGYGRPTSLKLSIENLRTSIQAQYRLSYPNILTSDANKTSAHPSTET